jgi:hypothetical protein
MIPEPEARKGPGRPPAPPENKRHIFWARARGYQLANFRPEKTEAGRVVQHEQPLVFVDHILVTDDPKKIKYIRKSNAFDSGAIKECETMEEAQRLSVAVGVIRQVRTISSTYEDKGLVPNR